MSSLVKTFTVKKEQILILMKIKEIFVKHMFKANQIGLLSREMKKI